MGILAALFGAEQRKYGADHDYWYTAISAFSPTKSGPNVTADSAMRSAAVFACVRVLAESVASLPIHLYRRLPNGGKERARDHPIYWLLHDRPNEYMTSYQWIETAVFQMALIGNHYCELERGRRGEISGVIPWEPSRVTRRETKSGAIVYEFQKDDGTKIVKPAEAMLHIPAFSWNGIDGLSVVSYARETIGLSLAAEEFGARFFGQGMNPGHIMTLPEGQRFDDEQTRKFLGDLSEKYSGLGKSHKVLVLPNGMDTKPVGIPPEDAQYLELRKFQVEDIARLYRVPLHMIQSQEKSTSWGTGIEQMTQGFVTYTLRPWLTRIEQVLERRLLSEAERDTYFVEFLAEALLRGDQKARSEYYTAAIQNGWMSRNEVRIIENLNPVDGGDEFLVPLNMSVAGEEPPEPPTEQPVADDEARSCGCGHDHAKPERRAARHPRQAIQRAFVRVIADALGRVIRRERHDVLRAAEGMFNKRKIERRAVQEFTEWLEQYYEELREFTTVQITPPFLALGEAVGEESMRELQRIFEMNEQLDAWMDSYIDNFSARHSNRQLQELVNLVETTTEEGGDYVKTLTQRFDAWEDPDDMARALVDAGNESVRLGQGFSRVVYSQAGVETLIWTATGEETCPMCMHLEGRVIAIQNNFVDEGESIGDFKPSTTIAHPPLHLGCDCVIVPGV